MTWIEPSILTAAGLAGGVLGKVLWDWVRKSTTIPSAGNGYMTLRELQEHCNRQQAGCVQLLRTEIQLLVSKVDGRLELGDRHFKGYEDRFKRIEAQLERLIELQRGNGNGGRHT